MNNKNTINRHFPLFFMIFMCLALYSRVSAVPSDVQRIYDEGVANFRSLTFLPIDLYLKQLKEKYEAEIASRERLLPTYDEVCQEAKQVAMAKKEEIITRITAKYSGESLILELNSMTQNSFKHPKLGNFDIIRRVAPNVQWNNWKEAPVCPLETILEQMQEEYKRQAYSQLDGDNVLAKIETNAKKKYPLLKVGSRISLELVGGTPASRRINQMYLTSVNSDSIILNNGARKIRRNDLSAEDQARIFKDAHDAYIAKMIKQEQQAFWGKVNKLCEQEITKNVRDLLLENGYIPNPQKNNPLSSFDWLEKIPECWTAKMNYVTFARETLIAQDVNYEMNTTFIQYMHDNGYIEIPDERAVNKVKVWVTNEYKDFMDFKKGKQRQFDRESSYALHGRRFAVYAPNGEIVLITPQEAYMMERTYMLEFMKNYAGAIYQEDFGYFQLSETEVLYLRSRKLQAPLH